MCTCRVFCRWLPVLFVVGLIAWCYYVYTSDILLPMLAMEPGQPTDIGSHETGVACATLFNIFFALGMISFLAAIFTDPGRIPATWVVDSADTEAGAFFPQLQTLETKHDGTRRICRKSKPNVYKPDRAHFCKMLVRCVLKMDHFCPWLNNCIGFHNHKYFYLFILYMATLCVFMLVTMTPMFVHDVTSMEEVMIDFTVRPPPSAPRPPPLRALRIDGCACARGSLPRPQRLTAAPRAVVVVPSRRWNFA